MKTIDTKSLIIGALLTSTIFLGVAATGTTDKWDGKQEWAVTVGSQVEYKIGKENPERSELLGTPTRGWEPIGVQGANIIFRKRTK